MTRTLQRITVLTALILGAFPLTPAEAACHEASFAGTPYSVNESAEKVTITVSNGGGAGVGSIDYETKNGSAKAPKDYKSKKGTLAFAPGTSELSFDVVIEDDGSDEQNETFLVELKNPQGCFSSIPDEPATVTIRDNDEKAIAQPPPTPTPTKTTPKPKPSTVSASPSPSPPSTPSPLAQAEPGDGGLSGGALAGIVGATIVLGGAAAFWVRRRFLT